MYVNEKMRPVETILGMGEGGKGKWWRMVNSCMLYYRSFCKCNHVTPAQ
jgi:hypothetical protein